MFISHLSATLIGKRISPHIPLWLLILASILTDLSSLLAMLLKTQILMGHNIYFIIISSIVFCIVGFLIRQNIIDLLVLGLLPVSHMLLDLISSKLKWWYNGPAIGLALNNLQVFHFLFESSLFIFCIIYYYNQGRKTANQRTILLLLCIILISMQALYDFLFIKSF